MLIFDQRKKQAEMHKAAYYYLHLQTNNVHLSNNVFKF